MKCKAKSKTLNNGSLRYKRQLILLNICLGLLLCCAGCLAHSLYTSSNLIKNMPPSVSKKMKATANHAHNEIPKSIKPYMDGSTSTLTTISTISD